MTVTWKPEDLCYARGRNGDFDVAEIDIWENRATGEFQLSVWSKRKGNNAPVRINLSASDLEKLGRSMQAAGATTAVLNRTEEGT